MNPLLSLLALQLAADSGLFHLKVQSQRPARYYLTDSAGKAWTPDRRHRLRAQNRAITSSRRAASRSTCRPARTRSRSSGGRSTARFTHVTMPGAARPGETIRVATNPMDRHEPPRLVFGRSAQPPARGGHAGPASRRGPQPLSGDHRLGLGQRPAALHASARRPHQVRGPHSRLQRPRQGSGAPEGRSRCRRPARSAFEHSIQRLQFEPAQRHVHAPGSCSRRLCRCREDRLAGYRSVGRARPRRFRWHRPQSLQPPGRRAGNRRLGHDPQAPAEYRHSDRHAALVHGRLLPLSQLWLPTPGIRR